MSLADVSRIAGIPRPTLHHYETGEIGLPLDKLPAWAGALGVWADVIVADVPAEWPEQLDAGQRKLLDAVLAAIPQLDGDQCALLAETVSLYVRANRRR